MKTLESDATLIHFIYVPRSVRVFREVFKASEVVNQ